MKQFSLLKWGLIVLAAAIVVAAMMAPGASLGPLSDSDRGQLVGEAVGDAALWIIGFGLIIAHFAKKRRNK